MPPPPARGPDETNRLAARRERPADRRAEMTVAEDRDRSHDSPPLAEAAGEVPGERITKPRSPVVPRPLEPPCPEAPPIVARAPSEPQGPCLPAGPPELLLGLVGQEDAAHMQIMQRGVEGLQPSFGCGWALLPAGQRCGWFSL